MFENAELKIHRANKHIEEFNSVLRRYVDENAHSVVIKFDPNFGCDVLEISAPENPLPRELPLIIGDAIHNLHAALDFIWYEFVSTFAAPSPYTRFPFDQTKTGVANALTARKIPESHQAVAEFVLEGVKPYKGSDTNIWAFHDLDITDKHEYLIPQLKFTSIWNVRAEAEDGAECPLPKVRTLSPGWPPSALTLVGKRNVKLTDKGKMVANVVFYKGPLRGWQVNQALVAFHDAVELILEEFRALIGSSSS
jgi:hypothetical protein